MQNVSGIYAESLRRGTRGDASGTTIPSLTVSPILGERAATGPIGSILLAVATASATAAVQVSPGLGTITLSVPSVVLHAGGTFAVSLDTITLVAPIGIGSEVDTATGDVGEITVMPFDASVALSYSADIGTVTVSAPDASVTAPGSATGALSTIGVFEPIGVFEIPATANVSLTTITVNAAIGLANNVAPPPTHRYWRLYFGYNGGGGFSLNQIYLYDDTSTNIAPSATLTASSTFSGSVSSMNDGVGSSTWGTVADNNEWVVADFGLTPVTIDSWALLSSPNGTQAPNWHWIQWSDDGTVWTTVAYGWINFWHNSTLETFVINPFGAAGAHGYWGLACVASAAANDFSAGELEIRATVGGTDQCMGGTAFGPLSFVSTPPANMFDQDITTPWASGGIRFPGIPITYQFPASVLCAQIALSSEPTNYPKTPSIFDVISSDDGQSYTVAWRVTGAVWSSAGQTQTFDNPAANQIGTIQVSAPGVTVTAGQNLSVSIGSISVSGPAGRAGSGGGWGLGWGLSWGAA